MTQCDSLENNPILTGVIWKQLLIFFFPLLLGSLLQVLYNTVDAIVVGKYVGTVALAAVGGPTGTLINLVIGFFVGLTSGATVVIAQYYGGGDEEKTSAAVHTAIALSLTGGLLIGVLGIWLARPALALMSTPDEVMPHAAVYLQIFWGGALTLLVYNMAAGILRAHGDSKRPFVWLGVGVVFNVIADLLFVIKFGWGVAGVAWASVLSQGISAVGVWWCLAHETGSFRLCLSKLRFDPRLLRNIFAVGVPMGLQASMYSISNVVIQAAVNSFGVNIVAVWTIMSKSDQFYWQMMTAFGMALSTFAAQNFGARQYDRVLKSIHVCTGIAFAATIAFSAVYLSRIRPIFLVFTDDEAVIGAGVTMVWTIVPYYFTYVLIETLGGGIRGTGDSFAPTVMTAVGICVVRLAIIWCVLPFWRDFRILGWSYPISWVATSIPFIIYYRCSGWLQRSIKRAGHV